MLYQNSVLQVFDRRINTSVPMGESTNSNWTFLPGDFKWAASERAMVHTGETLARVIPELRLNVLLHDEALRGGGDAPAHEDGKLNILLRNNLSTPERHIPLTPWMALHRVFHVLQSGFDTPDTVTGKGEYFKDIGFAYARLLGSNNRYRHGYSILDDWHSDLYDFMKVVTTFRSSRKNIISQGGDLLAELFAQHHLGGIAFLPASEWLAKAEGRSDTWYDRNTKQTTSNIKEILANTSEAECDEMMWRLARSIGMGFERVKREVLGIQGMYF
jgi:hypothetical protein